MFKSVLCEHPPNEQRRFNSVPYHLSGEKKKKSVKKKSPLTSVEGFLYFMFCFYCELFSGWPPLRQTTIFSGVTDLYS